MGTVSVVVSFDDEDAFLSDMQSIMGGFHELSQKYGCRNVILDVITWDSIMVNSGTARERILLWELPADVSWVKLLERELRRAMEENGKNKLGVEEIKEAIEAVNSAIGSDFLRYDAYDLGLNVNQAYIILDIAALYYLEGAVSQSERDLLYDLTERLTRWIG